MVEQNIFGIIVAGGKGTRMGNVEKPKQFMEIGGKPIIIHTIEKFVINNKFKEIVVLSPKQWIKHTKDIINKYIIENKKVNVIEGGPTRNDTVMNAISYIEEKYGLREDTIIVTHDSVRPFVTQRVIEENIQYAINFGACSTAVAATDTIIESTDGRLAVSIPDRAAMYQAQTPQSFRALKLREFYNSLSDSEKETLTDACKIMVLKGEKVYLVKGEAFNIKITYPYDIKVAESLLGGSNEKIY